MRKISVSIPTFEWQREGIWGSEEMQCKGQVARMHKKSLSESDGKSPRKKESSLVPPIAPRKLSASSQSSSSSSRDYLGTTWRTKREKDEEIRANNFDVQEEIGYLESEKYMDKNTLGKLGNKGYKLYTVDETKRLPKILKPKETSKNSKRKRKGHATTEMETATGESPTSADTGMLSLNSREDLGEWKYGLDWRRSLDWDITRPFTYSYFPKIYEKRKKKQDEKATNQAKKTHLKGAKTPFLPK